MRRTISPLLEIGLSGLFYPKSTRNIDDPSGPFRRGRLLHHFQQGLGCLGLLIHEIFQHRRGDLRLHLPTLQL